MNDLPIMYVFDCESDLRKIVKDLIFSKKLKPFFSLLDLVSEVASVCELHDDSNFALFSLVDLTEANDVNVIKFL